MKVRKAIFPVGGLGTRFLPATKALPKEMLPLANKPLIQHAFEEAVKAGIEEFIFITGRNKNIINNHFDCVYELEKWLDEREKPEALDLTRAWVPQPGNIAFIRQQNPLGLGHAVWCARHFIKDEPFAVLLADEMFLSDRSDSLLSEMVKYYEELQSNIIAVSDIDPKFSASYGIVKPTSDDGTLISISDMVEKPKPEAAPSNISIVGRYILSPRVFEVLDSTPAGGGGEIQLTDALKRMLDQEKFYGYRFKGKRFDCGNQLGLLKANIEFALAQSPYSEELRKYMKQLVE